MFKQLESMGYYNYLLLNNFNLQLNVDLKNYIEGLKLDKADLNVALSTKIDKDIWSSVNPHNNVPFPVELDDLIRLHFLTTSRKVTTILEFGVGSSTLVFDHALTSNKINFYDYASKNLRCSNLFECHSVDNNKKWIKHVKGQFKLSNTKIHYTKVRMGTFNDKVCTYYDRLPNICPDLIYLDGPDQESTIGEVRGVSTRSQDRLPMAADILAIEHLLLPKTLVVVDGRAGNARFLKANLQRKWSYTYIENYDQHFFELDEEPLGRINRQKVYFTSSQVIIPPATSF